LLETARVGITAGAENGKIDDSCGIGGDQLAALHAFHIDEAQAVAGMDLDGDSAPSGHGVALLAGSERAQARA
jgi:hypothetical protein